MCSHRTKALSLAVVATRLVLSLRIRDVALVLGGLLLFICSTHRHAAASRPSRSGHVN